MIENVNQIRLERFESLGDNCEFGFVLRALGNHTSSLLRWALLESVAATARGIRASFRDAFIFKNLEPSGGGLMVRDVTQGVAFHTEMRSVERDGRWEFIAPEDERRKIHEQESRKLDYLRQKFDRDIAGGQRIYVTKRNQDMSEADAAAVLDAVRFRGGGRVLYVTLADSSHPPGTVERVGDHLAHGWIDRFASYDQADDISLIHWQTLLAATEAVFASQADLLCAPRARPSRLLATLRSLFDRDPTAAESPAPPQPPQPAEVEAELAARLEAGGWFDAEIYAARFGSFDLGENPTVAHWLGAGRYSRIVPTSNFDEVFYLASNPDVAAAGCFGFEHFLLSGHSEGRAPLPPEDPRHRRIFAPWFYASQAGLPADDAEALWQHYLLHGLPKDVPPFPLFDPIFYATQIESHGLQPRLPGEAAIRHWFRVGVDAGIVPTPFFHEHYYRATQSDLVAEPFGFLHYILYGIRENRAPCFWFDPQFYAMQPGVPPDAGYDHFIACGLADGRLPSLEVDRLVQADDGRLSREDFTALMDVSAGWDGRTSRAALLMLASLYIPAWHAPAGTALQGFVAYLRAGAMTAPGPLFDPAIYRERAAAEGIPVPPGESSLLHWVRHGHAARIVPTDRYDEHDYCRANPKAIGFTGWGYEHFVRHGAAEGRSPRQGVAFHQAPAWGKTALPPLFETWLMEDFPSKAAGRLPGVPVRYTNRLNELLKSAELEQVFERAQRLDPDVGELATLSDFLLPPYHDPLVSAHGEILRRLPEKTYDTVICIPWIRVGGADLVAGLLGHALLRIRPAERVLYLRTDTPLFERAKWLPNGADVVDISDIVRSVSAEVAEHLLRLTLRGVTAKRMFNVNSRLCWTMLQNYGANLALTLNTYSYMFCWDQTPTGLRVGYPAEYFAATAATITAFLTDTDYLRDELSTMYRLPAAIRAKIVPLYSPAQTAARPVSIARSVLERADPASRRLVLWAGRLDRQKRFGLVLDIARRMPGVEFHCWGVAMLDTPPDLTALPPNVTMKGSFDHFDELPLEQAGAWLFTALWEGMPTMLIELASRGVTVVASAVGGVPELIQPDSGWPIPPRASPDDYVTALNHALNDPEEAMRRAESLQRRVTTRYNEQVYDAALDGLLTAETRL